MSAATRRMLIGAAGLLLYGLCASSLLTSDYGRFIAASVCVNAIAVLSISILAGTSGIWSLGHTAFLAIGAYAGANLAAGGWPIELIVPAVAAAAAAIGFAIGVVSGRFSSLYFALLTLAVTLTSVELIGRLSSLTGGDQGLVVEPMRSLLTGGTLTPDNAPQATAVLATLAFLLADVVIKGAPGRRWRAVKSQRIASAALGLSPALANAAAFAFSAALASAAGVGLAVTLGILDPLIFSLTGGIMLIVGTVVGGIGSFFGAVLGAGFIIGVPELGRSVPDIAAFVLGAVMIAVLLVLPQGLGPALLSCLRRTRRLASVAPPASASTIEQLVRDTMPACKAALEIRGLHVAFGGLQVLSGVSLDVAPGQTVGLIGPNGAGKTTLINVLSGFVRPSVCEAFRLGERDLRRASSQHRLGLGIGRTFQHAELFSDLTVREMLAVAAARRTLPQAGLVERILVSLNLLPHAEARPDTLPFGVQKVADIARALAAGANWIAMDEPFSGLDHAEIEELRAILSGMKAAGVSILIIDHAVQEVLGVADHVVVLNFGTVLASGPPAEIARNPAVQEAYFGTASRRSPRAGGTATEPPASPLLDLRGVGHRFSGVLALQDVSLRVLAGSFNAVLGPNGAGKSTLALIMGGLIRPSTGTVVSTLPQPRKTGALRKGVSVVPEGRRLFGQLSIHDNLVVAGYGAGLSGREIRDRMATLLPLLPERLRTGLRTRHAVSLSGGERQLLALVRALMSEPSLVVIDEPALGLAPVVIADVYGLLSQLRDDGVAVVVAEQIATHAAEHADTIHLLSRGRVVFSGPASGDGADEAIRLSYVGHVDD